MCLSFKDWQSFFHAFYQLALVTLSHERFNPLLLTYNPNQLPDIMGSAMCDTYTLRRLRPFLGWRVRIRLLDRRMYRLQRLFLSHLYASQRHLLRTSLR